MVNYDVIAEALAIVNQAMEDKIGSFYEDIAEEKIRNLAEIRDAR